MKKITLIFALGLFANFAQATDNRALELTRQLAVDLQLNEGQFIQVKNLEQQKFQAMDKALLNVADAAQKAGIQLDIEVQYNRRLWALLNPAQQQAYTLMLQAVKAPENLARK
ncbi:hypothetical protein [Adhaeribacter terreus]|uniref:DUF4168 domain-containing protein n=1 Tax=Adhaeribacter terreus TaxID=529703 RepID=A0ABW0EI91_9BACT